MNKPKSKIESESDMRMAKAGRLFNALVMHLTRRINDKESGPSDVIIKEARQFLKDWSWMIQTDEHNEVLRQLANPSYQQGAAPVHPFPVDKQA